MFQETILILRVLIAVLMQKHIPSQNNKRTECEVLSDEVAYNFENTHFHKLQHELLFLDVLYTHANGQP